MKRIKSIVCSLLVTLALSSTALAGDIHGVAGARPGDIHGVAAARPGDIHGVAGAAPGDIHGVYNTLVTIVLMVV